MSADAALVMNKVCFTRAGDGARLNLGANGVPYPGEVCNEGKIEPLPAIAAVVSVMDRLGIGLSVAPPALYGSLKFPETVPTQDIAGRSLSRSFRRRSVTC